MGNVRRSLLHHQTVSIGNGGSGARGVHLVPRSPSRPLAALSHPCLYRQASGCPARRSSPRQSPGNTLLRRGTRVDSDCLVNVEHLLSGIGSIGSLSRGVQQASVIKTAREAITKQSASGTAAVGHGEFTSCQDHRRGLSLPSRTLAYTDRRAVALPGEVRLGKARVTRCCAGGHV